MRAQRKLWEWLRLTLLWYTGKLIICLPRTAGSSRNGEFVEFHISLWRTVLALHALTRTPLLMLHTVCCAPAHAVPSHYRMRYTALYTPRVLTLASPEDPPLRTRHIESLLIPRALA
jgi:hypothetical protein